ncbi:MAG TPA: DNA recombination protein RmuC [Paludibacteraceae bacterium]|nr:DNA recombination protein RmuC [Paludibacteraceae bacterium]HQB69682.1 DNA recombination protein RmuC [Paludibacteraceae bacterium]HRS67856.1 DNA recombination protein RmuC [Paludibacteraceae bacterium]
MSVGLIVLIAFFAALLGFMLAYFMGNKARFAQSQLETKTVEAENLTNELATVRADLMEKTSELATLEANNGNLKEQLAVQKTELEELQKKLTTEFENIANKILKARADELSATSEKNLGAILNPLGDKINDFKKQVEEAFNTEVRDKMSLREQLKILTEQNARISDEANNLTKALKGDVKKQGNWGEIILERVLETSGLTKGREYEREKVVEGVQGEVYRPDVIVNLPDNKHIIIDSKVSLVAYERMNSAENEEEYNAALKEHLSSIKKHVRELADKNYQHALGINTPDFVLLFIPIEASFSIAVENDHTLFSEAWDRKIVIVSPTTLLATLRTVASIWKQENQTKNALEIARLSGTMYDKLVGFVADWNKVKENLDRAGKSCDDAMNKLKEGNGNVFRTADKIKQLGAKATKELPTELLDA